MTLMIRWFLSFMLLCDGLLLLQITQICVKCIKNHPEDHPNDNSRPSNNHILSYFALSGVMCLVLMCFTIPL